MAKKRSKKFTIGAVILLLIFIYTINKSKILYTLGGSAITPIQNFSQGASSSISSFLANIRGKNNNYCDENTMIEIQKIIQDEKIKILIEQNGNLKEMLNFLEDNDYLQNEEKRWETAYLIGRDTIDQSILIINKGKKNGLEVGMPVIKDKGILIGRIIKVENEYSHFILTTDNRSKIYAAINNEEEISGLTEGNYNLSIQMELIPINKNIKEGDIVTTSGEEKFIPPGLLIGTVKKINKMDNDIFQSAELEAFSSFDDIKIVTVIK
jgi:rod shape-determining protein MreC